MRINLKNPVRYWELIGALTHNEGVSVTSRKSTLTEKANKI